MDSKIEIPAKWKQAWLEVDAPSNMLMVKRNLDRSGRLFCVVIIEIIEAETEQYQGAIVLYSMESKKASILVKVIGSDLFIDTSVEGLFDRIEEFIFCRSEKLGKEEGDGQDGSGET